MFEGNALLSLIDRLRGTFIERTRRAALWTQNAIFGVEPDVTLIDVDGTITQHGNATAWDDILPYAVNPGTGLTAMSSGSYKSTNFKWYYWSDNHAADETLQLGFQIPHAARQYQTLKLHLHYVPSANGAGGNNTVILRVARMVTNINATYGSPTSSDVTLTIGASDADKHLVIALADLTGATLSSDVNVSITRLSKTSASDNYTGDVWFRFSDIHAEFDSRGSPVESSKPEYLADEDGTLLTDDDGAFLTDEG